MSHIIPLRARSEVSRGIQPGVNTPLDDRLAMRIYSEITSSITTQFEPVSNEVPSLDGEVPE